MTASATTPSLLLSGGGGGGGGGSGGSDGSIGEAEARAVWTIRALIPHPLARSSRLWYRAHPSALEFTDARSLPRAKSPA